ncbi:MAG: type II restriction endonuclease [Anaerovibrio sp.]
MAKRDFDKWLTSFRESIATYDYYVNYDKVYRNVDAIKIELNILNSLIGSKCIEKEFMGLLGKYPEVLKCIPILLAVREKEIFCQDENGSFRYRFTSHRNEKDILSAKQYAYFMQKTGLFELISKRIIGNLLDYVTGVETGLDSNGRKNRGGHLMENLVEKYIRKAGFKLNDTYFKEMYIHEITQKWGLDLSAISNQGKTEKRFDYVVRTDNSIYGIETNFYTGGGSKLNETARSYKTLALEAKTIDGFAFIWFTDGKGWHSARYNLEETFDVLDHVYNIKDMEDGIMSEVFR